MDKQRETKENTNHSSSSGKSRQRRLIFLGLIVINAVVVMAAYEAKGTNCALGAFLFSSYSWFWFHNGYADKVVNEWDIGSVEDGLKLMFKSWFWLAVCAIFIKNCTP